MIDEHRLKRLRLRSWRRGTKEMDLLLGPFAEANLGAMSTTDLDLYEELLGENDQDLYAWATGRATPPEHLAALVDRVVRTATNKSAQQSDVL